MHSRGWIGFLLFGGVAASFWPADARACSCLGTAIARSDPFDGAQDVAINRALVIEGYLDPASIRLENESGERVDVQVNHGPTPGCPGAWAELVPRQALDTNATYVIRAATVATVGDMPESVTFKTGTSQLPALTLQAPKGRVSVVEGFPQSGSSCGSTKIQACVGLEDAVDVEIIARRGDEIIMRWMMPHEEGNYGFEVTPDCLEFRRRGPTGQRSEPLIVCGEALGTRAFRASDMNGHEYLCHDGVTGVPEGDRTNPPVRPTDPPLGSAGARANAAGASAAGNGANVPLAGSRSSSERTPEPSDSAQRNRRSYGCGAAPGAPASAAAWYALLVMLAVQRVRRTRRARR
jgi:hypothetical protein